MAKTGKTPVSRELKEFNTCEKIERSYKWSGEVLGKKAKGKLGKLSPNFRNIVEKREKRERIGTVRGGAGKGWGLTSRTKPTNRTKLLDKKMLGKYKGSQLPRDACHSNSPEVTDDGRGKEGGKNHFF